MFSFSKSDNEKVEGLEDGNVMESRAGENFPRRER